MAIGKINQMITKSKSTIKVSEPKNNIALSLPPDGYSRFFVITRLLEEIYKKKNNKIKILDVGGCSPYLNECLKESGIKYELTIIDILPKPYDLDVDYIQGDITESNIEAGSYDVVVSTDVLEHIPKDLKNIFITSCIRLSSGLVIIAAPFDTEGVDKAEHIVNDFNKQLFGVGQDWLEEHFRFTKPSVSQTKKVLEEAKLSYINFGVNNLYSWILSTHTHLIQAKTGLNLEVLRKSNTEYNKKLSSSIEFTEPTYRQFFVIFKERSLDNGKLLQNIVGSQEPTTYMDYLNGVMKSIYDHSEKQNTNIENLHKDIELLNQRLEDERLLTVKAQADLAHFMNEKKNLQYVKKKVKKVVKKVMGK